MLAAMIISRNSPYNLWDSYYYIHVLQIRKLEHREVETDMYTDLIRKEPGFWNPRKRGLRSIISCFSMSLLGELDRDGDRAWCEQETLPLWRVSASKAPFSLGLITQEDCFPHREQFWIPSWYLRLLLDPLYSLRSPSRCMERFRSHSVQDLTQLHH